MSTRKVNLFTGPLSSLNAHSRWLKLVKFYSILLSLVLFALIFALYLYSSKLNGDIQIVQDEETAIEEVITKESARQNDLSLILSRVRLIQDALKNDVMYSSKSAALGELFSNLAHKPSVDETKLIGPKDFQLKLTFSTQNDLLSFIKSTESPEFESRLSAFSIGSFRISMASSSGSVTLLDFTGSFL